MGLFNFSLPKLAKGRSATSTDSGREPGTDCKILKGNNPSAPGPHLSDCFWDPLHPPAQRHLPVSRLSVLHTPSLKQRYTLPLQYQFMPIEAGSQRSIQPNTLPGSQDTLSSAPTTNCAKGWTPGQVGECRARGGG